MCSYTVVWHLVFGINFEGLLCVCIEKKTFLNKKSSLFKMGEIMKKHVQIEKYTERERQREKGN